MPVAVVTRSDIRSDIGFAQGHCFAVIGVAIMSQAVLVAAAATLVAGHFEMAVFGGFDLVRGVAVGTDRATFVALGQQLAMHALVIGLFDANMAFAAGLGDVRRMNGGITVD